MFTQTTKLAASAALNAVVPHNAELFAATRLADTHASMYGAVEMESGVHASFAAARGLPFLVLRVILDPVGMALPVLKGFTTPEGGVRPFRAVSHVVTHPHHLPVLLALKRSRAVAARTLSELCRALFPLLG